MTSQTSALVKAAGIVIGECLFGLYGPFFLVPALSWFEMNYPGALMIGVLLGGAAGYGVAALALRVYRRATTASHQPRHIPVDAHLPANLRA